VQVATAQKPKVSYSLWPGHFVLSRKASAYWTEVNVSSLVLEHLCATSMCLSRCDLGAFVRPRNKSRLLLELVDTSVVTPVLTQIGDGY
jgi:hypothetical protein